MQKEIWMYIFWLLSNLNLVFFTMRMNKMPEIIPVTMLVIKVTLIVGIKNFRKSRPRGKENKTWNDNNH